MARRPHGFIYALLALSLAVNLIGAGYLGYGSWRTKAPRSVDSTIDFIANRYPKGVGDKVRERLQAKRADIAQALDELKEARRATRRAMGEQPLERDRVEAAFAHSREKADAFSRLVHGAIVDALPELPEIERGGIDKNESD